MSQLVSGSGVFHTVDLLALPLNSVDRRILVKAFPPYGVVVEILRNVGKDGALSGGGESVGVGLLVGAGSDAEEAVFGVDRPESAVRTDSQPADVVADTPDLVALLLVDLRRNHHSEVGLAAGRGESGANVLDFAFGILQTEDQHMLSHPAFLPALVGGNAEREALLAEEDVSAVSGVDGNDGIVLRELADVSLFLVNVALGVQTLDPVGVLVAESVQNSLAATGHNGHIQNNIDGIGDFQTNLGELRTNRAHGIGDDVHGSAGIGASGDVIEHLVCVGGSHPVVGGTCFLFGVGADECASLNTGDVVGLGAVQIAAGELFLVELDHFAGLACFLAESLELFLGAVDPNDLIGFEKLGHFVEPCEH